MKLVLLRHGQTQANCDRALDTAMPGLPLNEVGREQVARTAVDFVELVGAPPTVVAISPLRRTQQSAAPLLAAFDVPSQLEPGVVEVGAGELEMRLDPEAIKTYLGCALAWLQGDLDRRMPGGQDGHEVFARWRQVVQRTCQRAVALAGDEAVAVLVIHGALSRLIAHSLSAQVTLPLVANVPMPNASVTVLENAAPIVDYCAPTWRTIRWGSIPVEQLPREMPWDGSISPSRIDSEHND